MLLTYLYISRSKRVASSFRMKCITFKIFCTHFITSKDAKRIGILYFFTNKKEGSNCQKRRHCEATNSKWKIVSKHFNHLYIWI